MEQQIRDQVDWPQAFPPEEYAARQTRLKSALSAAELDGILVTEPRDLYYLTGYDQIWQHHLGVIGLYVRTATGERLFFDSAAHQVIVATTPEIGEVLYHPRGTGRDQARFVARELTARGWDKGRIALQTWGYGPHPDLLRAIGADLPGATIVEDSTLIEDLRLIKSTREIAVVRQAAEIAKEAMAPARDALRPDLAETEIAAVIAAECMNRGCGDPGIRTMIGSGPRSGCHHGPASARRLKAGDIVHIDFCASLHRYHVNISRTFALGEVDRRWHDLMAASAGCMDAIAAEAKPGEPYSRIQEIADRFIADAGIDPAWIWLIGGYVLGIAFPPDWVHRHRPAPREIVPDPVMAPGMVFNYENQYDVLEGWPGGTGVGVIDSFLMGDDGLEILTDLPRELIVAGG
ncbi:MAG: Xaa-Pro peptidase family protein [Pseudomonadota bacterium]